MTQDSLTQARLKELLHYNPHNGLFNWVDNRNNQVNIGDQAGSKDKDGYIIIHVGDKHRKAHRLAFLYMTGSYPVNHVDHEDHVRHNNTWSNLNDVLNIDNTHNQMIPLNNTSGYMGVSWHIANQRWRSRISFKGKRLSLGCFVEYWDALCARKSAERDYGFHLNHGGR